MSHPSNPDAKPVRSSIPYGLLGALPLLLLVEWLIHRADVHLMTPDQWYTRDTVEAAAKLAPGRDFLVFGDSLAKFSIAPKQIEAETGLRGYNLALSGTQASNSYYMLKHAVEAGARPKFVVVDFFPPLQRLPLSHVIENDPFMLSIRDAAELGRKAGDLSFFASVAARVLVPSIRLQNPIRTIAVAHVKKTFERRWAAYAHPVLMNQKHNDGAQIHPSGKTNRLDLNKLNADYFPRWEVGKLQEEYMRKFFDLSARVGAKVVWLLPPYMPELHRLTVASGFDADWTRFIESWRAEFPNISVFDARESTFPDDAFMDPNHLARSGSAVFSSDLGKMLRELDSPGNSSARWVAAGSFRTLSGPDRLVDIVESGEEIRRTARERAANRLRR